MLKQVWILKLFEDYVRDYDIGAKAWNDQAIDQTGPLWSPV